MIQRIAGKAIIVDEQNRLLVVRRDIKYKDGPNAGRWDFPGGRVKEGENFVDGLKRELIEEVGLKVEIVRPIYVGEKYPVVKGEQLQIFLVYCLCKTDSFSVDLGSENDQYEWIAKDKATKLDLIDPSDDLFQLIVKGKMSLT